MTDLIKNAGKFISVYRILFIVGGIVVSFIFYQQTKIWNAQRKLKNAQEKTQEIKIKLTTRDAELDVCQTINDNNKLELSNAISIANQCTNQWKQVKDNNELAIKQLKSREKSHAQEIERIKNIKPVTDCDNELLDDNVARWLQGKNSDS